MESSQKEGELCFHGIGVEVKKWKVWCKNCKKEYEMEIGNITGLRKQYCLYCRCVGTLMISNQP